MMGDSHHQPNTDAYNDKNNDPTNSSINDDENSAILFNMTEALHKTRIGAANTAQMTEETTENNNNNNNLSEEEEVVGDLGSQDASSDLDSSSFGSSSGGFWNSSIDGISEAGSDSTRSRTFSIYCLREVDDDCSSISTVSHFLRDEEDVGVEEILDDSSSCWSIHSSNENDADENDSRDELRQTKSLIDSEEEEEVVLEEIYDDESDLDGDYSDSDFSGESDDHEEFYYQQSYDDDEDLDFIEVLVDDEYGDEYGTSDEDDGGDNIINYNDNIILANKEIVLETAGNTKPQASTSDTNNRKSHARKMALFQNNLAETKQAAGIMEDEFIGFEEEEEYLEEIEDVFVDEATTEEHQEELVVEEIEEELVSEKDRSDMTNMEKFKPQVSSNANKAAVIIDEELGDRVKEEYRLEKLILERGSSNSSKNKKTKKKNKGLLSRKAKMKKAAVIIDEELAGAVENADRLEKLVLERASSSGTKNKKTKKKNKGLLSPKANTKIAVSVIDEVLVQEEEDNRLEEKKEGFVQEETAGDQNDMVFEKGSDRRRVFSNANSRQSHTRQMAYFVMNITATKKAAELMDDELEEKEDQEELVKEIEEFYVEESEFDGDEGAYIYEIIPPTPKAKTPKKLKPKTAKRKEIERQRRLSLLSV